MPAADTARRASSGTKARSFNLTDAGNAEYFATRFGRDIRFDHRRKRWLVYVGHRWMPDVDGEVLRRAKGAVRQRMKDAADIEDADKKRQAMQHALASESRGRLAAMLALASAERPIADAGDQWDADPWLLGTPNGVIDLRNGVLRAGTRDDRLTMNTAVPFHPDAECPRFTRFLEEVFNGSRDLISFVHRAIGYTLSGVTCEQCLFVSHGAGANGKTTLLQTLMHLLGDYALNAPFSTVERQRATIPNDLAALVNRRFVMASETNDGTELNEARVKALTGGDPVSARFLHCEWFEFVPTAKFWLAVNHRPVVRDDSYGFWRRIRLIPFARTFAVDAGLGNELRAEAPGILAWAVRGCTEWQRRHLTPPAAVLEATRTYEHDSDPLAGFIEEACDCRREAETGASDLYAHYQQWAQRHHLTERERLSATMFGRKLAERFERQSTRTGKVYRNIARRSL